MFFLSKSFSLHCFPVNGGENNGSSSEIDRLLINTEDTDKNKSSPRILKDYSFKWKPVLPVYQLLIVSITGFLLLGFSISCARDGGSKPAAIFGAMSLACLSVATFMTITNIEVQKNTIQKDAEEAFGSREIEEALGLYEIRGDGEQELSGEMNNLNTINTDEQNRQLQIN